MSGDEVLVLVLSVAATLILWGRWYLSRFLIGSLIRRPSGMEALGLLPPVALGILFAVLRRFASHDVRDSAIYLSFYLLMGSAWVALALLFLPLTGLSHRDDVLERGNAAASWAWGGALIGITLCFAGGNIGDGPGWWVVVFCALLSTTGLYVVWMALSRWGYAAEAITVERDTAAGIRAAGFLVACGAILGRAVAGDWVSAEATLRDFCALGWPVLPLLALEMIAARFLRPTPGEPNPPAWTHGVIPALGALAFGVAALVLAGSWETAR